MMNLFINRSSLRGYIAVIVLGLLFAASIAIQAGAVEVYPDTGWLKIDEYPIGFWWPPVPSETTVERYREIAEARFNTVMGGNGVNNYEDNMKMLDCAQKNGLKVFVMDGYTYCPNGDESRLNTYSKKAVERYKDHPALWGYMLYDEPSAAQFEPISIMNRMLLEKDPDHIPYVNLLPTYASKQQLGTETYQEHVDKFLSTVKPKILSFDFYPFVDDTVSNPENYIPWDFFYNLHIIREKSLEYNVPFWTFIQAEKFEGMREPSVDEIRWQIYNNLAYGAKGIFYFLYWAPSDAYDGIFTRDGKRTFRYDNVKRINQEVQALGATLLKLKSTSVYHSGEIPLGLPDNDEDGLIAGVSGCDLVIGTFVDGEGTAYMMVVNGSFVENAESEITLNKAVSGVEIPKPYGSSLPFNFNSTGKDSTVLKIGLGPGEGRLFRLVQQ